MLKIIDRLYTILYLLTRVNWVAFYKLKQKDHKNVIWIPTHTRKKIGQLKGLGSIIHDLAIIQCFVEANVPFCIRQGLTIGDLTHRNIFYTVERYYNPFGVADYCASLLFALQALEKAQNTLFPSHNEVSYWENKAFMHEKFAELNIPHPQTWIIRKGDALPDVAYPILIKEIHSAGSAGVFKVNSRAEVEQHRERLLSEGHDTFLMQKLVNMRSDLRVTLIGDEIVLHYWRINNDTEWKPTSTGRGSSVDFDTFPEQWRQTILDNFKKLNIRTGAFDITWDNDDTQTPPIFLEVSPVYQPNPRLPERFKHLTYAAYKKQYLVKEGYYKEYIDIIFDLKRKLYRLYFNDIKF